MQGEYKDIYQLLQNLAALRKQYKLSESVVSITSKEDVLIVEHATEKDRVSLLINLTDKEKTINGITIKTQGYALCINEGVVDYE